jgi:hypothetical protein
MKSVDHPSANVHQGSLIKSTKSCVDPSLPGLSFVVDNSDSVHYGPLTQLIVSSGSSCHTRVQIIDTREKSQPLPSYRSSSPPSWVHIFSKTTANSSLRTQCAAAAAADVPPPIVFHCCLCQARKKLKKQERVLREVVVPMTQLKITTSKINN